MNRCFEALERADISQAPDTATQPPRHRLASLPLPTHLLKLVVRLGTWDHTSLVGRWDAREVQTHCQVSYGPWTLSSKCPQVG